MALNNYLVVGVNPANNETSVPLNKEISITFSQHMNEASLNSENVVLREVNGDIVECTRKYTTSSISLRLKPTADLKAGKEYELLVMGGTNGIKTITGDYLGATRTYKFTTNFEVQLGAPTKLKATIDSGFVTLTWERPVDYNPVKQLIYEAQVSLSNDPLNPPVWPATGDINKTGGNILNVPKKLSDGNYYAYVRATEGDSVSDWASVQFLVETPVVINPPNPGDGGNGDGDDGDGGDDGNGDIFEFDVSNTFPSRDQVDITPEKVIIIFSDAVDGDTVNSDSIYIVKREGKKSMNILDFMTLYSPSKQIKSTIEPIETPNIITITAEFEDDAEYTVVVRETVKSKNGSALGVAYHWAFMTHFTYLYGDPQSVRDDIGSASDSYSDKSLYKYMRDISNYAYEVVSGNADFSASDYADGKAPYYVHQYVRFKTGYDLLINSQLRSVADGDVGGIHQYKLGDLTITKDAVGSGAAADMSTLLDELKTKMKVWEDLLHGQHNRGYAKPTYVVPGENSTDTYPDFFDRSEFKDLGE